jgi:hypothetical protein
MDMKAREISALKKHTVTQQKTVTSLQMESKRQAAVLTRRQRLLEVTQKQLKTSQAQLLEVMMSQRRREANLNKWVFPQPPPPTLHPTPTGSHTAHAHFSRARLSLGTGNACITLHSSACVPLRLRRSVGGTPFALGERKERSKSPPSSPYDGSGAGGEALPTKEVTSEELASTLELYKERIDAEVTGGCEVEVRVYWEDCHYCSAEPCPRPVRVEAPWCHTAESAAPPPPNHHHPCGVCPRATHTLTLQNPTFGRSRAHDAR